MPTTRAFAAQSATSRLAPFTIERREPGPHDVQIEILYCGVCHTDLHQARNDWRESTYPMVPGHEILGKVVKTGAQAKKFSVGELAGVGCMVDSCRACASCRDGLEQYCESGPLWTYNSRDASGATTYGGYSERIVVDEAFAVRVPAKLDAASAAPLLCAGITTYSPLRHWKAGRGTRVGVVGLGGLGHVGVKIARALGSEVVVFTTSPGKKADAVRLGAHEVVLSRDAAAMEASRGRFDLILDTVSARHELESFVSLLKVDGTLVQVGLPSTPLPLAIHPLTAKRRSVSGSTIGGIAETQEMLDFCAGHGISCDIEMIPMHKINEAYERLLKNDVRYRFVIDMATLKS